MNDDTTDHSAPDDKHQRSARLEDLRDEAHAEGVPTAATSSVRLPRSTLDELRKTVEAVQRGEDLVQNIRRRTDAVTEMAEWSRREHERREKEMEQFAAEVEEQHRENERMESERVTREKEALRLAEESHKETRRSRIIALVSLGVAVLALIVAVIPLLVAG